MSSTEQRLSGKQADLSGIVQYLDRHMGRPRIERIEIRLSDQAPKPLALAAVRERIKALLLEHGKGNVQLSVRHFELPMDNALGEHVVRIVCAEALDKPAAMPGAEGRGFLRLWRWLKSWFKGEQAATTVAAPPGPDKRRATELLRQAIELAGRTSGISLNGQAVAQAIVEVHLPELDAVLRPQMPPLESRGATWVAERLNALGVATRPDMVLTYRFNALAAEEGTRFAHAADIEVKLWSTPVSTASDSTARSVAAMVTTQGTAMPWRGQLRARVKGTLEHDFDQPFDLYFDQFPAQLDRSALEAAGFGQRHGDLLCVASNSRPLRMEHTDARVLRLIPQGESAASGCMYFWQSNQLPLGQNVSIVPGQPAHILIGLPAGMEHPKTRQRLPPLVVEIGWASAG